MKFTTSSGSARVGGQFSSALLSAVRPSDVDGPQSFVSNTWRLDDVQLQVVPEPALAGLAIVGCGSLLAARRSLSRRRRGRPESSVA